MEMGDVCTFGKHWRKADEERQKVAGRHEKQWEMENDLLLLFGTSCRCVE